jgi:hypothetical protein
LVTIVESVTNPQTLSIILELASLFFIILGFFRWYDRKYSVVIDKTVAGITEKINDVKKSIETLSDDYHNYVQSRALQKLDHDDNKQPVKRRTSKR